MKTCNADIRERAAAIRAEDSDMNTRTAWNFATTQVLAELKESDPAAVERLQKQAKDIREMNSRNWAEHDPETLREVMRSFEKRLLTTVREWGRTTGAAIYVAAMFDTEDTGLKFVEYVSRH
ncbi:hypothetical protein FRC08_003630 [Ceratobasidium sp. 394]|nr:hypothetical protein FRC08_003630 [Ceratobasidium sp. 394]